MKIFNFISISLLLFFLQGAFSFTLSTPPINQLHFNSIDGSHSIVLKDDCHLIRVEDSEVFWDLDLLCDATGHLRDQSRTFQYLLRTGNKELITLLNYPNSNESQIRKFTNDGFASTSQEREFIFDSLITSVNTLHILSEDSHEEEEHLLITYLNGDVIELNTTNVKIIKQYNLYFLKDIAADQLRVEVLNNGNILFYFVSPTSTYNMLSYIHYSRRSTQAAEEDEDIHPFNFETFENEKLSDISEVYGTKIIVSNGTFFKLIQVDAKDGSILSDSKPLPGQSGTLPVSINSESKYFTYSATNHQLSCFDLLDLTEPMFTIENILNYRIQLTDDFLVLLTEYHLRLLDIDSGLELKSIFLGKNPVKFDKLANWEVNTIGEDVFFSLKYGNGITETYHNSLLILTFDGSTEVTDTLIININAPLALNDAVLHYQENELDLIRAYLYRLTRHYSALRRVYRSLFDYYITGENSTSDKDDSRDLDFGFVKHIITAYGNGVIQAVSTSNTKALLWSLDVEGKIIKLEKSESHHEILVFVNDGRLLHVSQDTGAILKTSLIPKDITHVRPMNGDQFLLSLSAGFHLLYHMKDDNSHVTEPLYFVHQQDSTTLSGFELDNNEQVSSTWSHTTSTKERILKWVQSPLSHYPVSQIATIDPISGLRYKALNPHLITLATFNAELSTLQIILKNAITGEVHHHVTHENVLNDGSFASGFDVIMGEHYVIYSYYSSDVKDSGPGQRIVVWDLYKSSYPESYQAEVSAFNETDFNSIAIYSRTYILSYKIKQLQLTQSLHGVTKKALIVSLTNGQILQLDKLTQLSGNPPAVTSKNDHVIINVQDLKSYVINPTTGKSLVIDTRSQLLVSPTELESTILLFVISPSSSSYGPQMIKLTPSGSFDTISSDSFNYKFVVLTIIVLITINLGLWWGVGVKKLKKNWVSED